MRAKFLMLSAVLAFSVLFLVGCAGAPPTNMGLQQGQFAACPASPNCVSSFQFDVEDEHHFPIYGLADGHQEFWNSLTKAVAALPRTTILSQQQPYLYAQSHSRVFGFVDDVQVYWDVSNQRLYFYSASRVGYSDLGVNRARLEQLVELLKQDVTLKPISEN